MLTEIHAVNIDNFEPTEINKYDIKLAIRQTNTSNVCGNDNISSKMVTSCDSSFV